MGVGWGTLEIQWLDVDFPEPFTGSAYWMQNTRGHLELLKYDRPFDWDEASGKLQTVNLHR